jgi:hypothetical protein
MPVITALGRIRQEDHGFGIQSKILSQKKPKLPKKKKNPKKRKKVQ